MTRSAGHSFSVPGSSSNRPSAPTATLTVRHALTWPSPSETNSAGETGFSLAKQAGHDEETLVSVGSLLLANLAAVKRRLGTLSAK